MSLSVRDAYLTRQCNKLSAAMITLNNKAENSKAVEAVKNRMINHFNKFLSLINTNGIEISENDDDREIPKIGIVYAMKIFL